ncbi:MAG: hypothetical protein IKN54_04885 [Lachnospiraceae bacterium]|nr:hypothetical protein [Lachnospiraceae bacterium]
MEKKRIEGLWDCKYCGSVSIKARYASCPQCSRARGPETVFYLPDDIESAVLTKEEAEKTSNGPDWLCEYCGSYNRCDREECSNCGSPRSEAKTNYGLLHRLTGLSFKKKKD